MCDKDTICRHFYTTYDVRELGKKIENSEYDLLYMVMNEDEVVYKTCVGSLYANVIVLSTNESELRVTDR